MHLCVWLNSCLTSAAVSPLLPLPALPQHSAHHKHSSAHSMDMISWTGSVASVPPHGTTHWISICRREASVYTTSHFANVSLYKD